MSRFNQHSTPFADGIAYALWRRSGPTWPRMARGGTAYFQANSTRLGEVKWRIAHLRGAGLRWTAVCTCRRKRRSGFGPAARRSRTRPVHTVESACRINRMEKAWVYPVVAEGKPPRSRCLWCYDIRRGRKQPGDRLRERVGAVCHAPLVSPCKHPGTTARMPSPSYWHTPNTKAVSRKAGTVSRASRSGLRACCAVARTTAALNIARQGGIELARRARKSLHERSGAG